MKIFICCSKHMYGRIPPIKEQLERRGHVITMPNNYDNPAKEEEMRKDKEEHASWKANMLKLQEEKVKRNDAILVLNYEKKGQKNYIGGATFLEMFKAFELKKKIFMMNPIPDNILADEIAGFMPTIIHQDLTKI